ncbi:translesion DNA synthesis-associated protein ImuA [Vibrio viridaestus]|uniref:Translesion DNA synthesis-associated protein ImuA n=1 Tax=Vibrio viridaestus TaxID=2487322 RepID=A0A3N9U3S2_9VIBR|nr:translesion DNA synthesis-associated protein ImuA [Vibrio viridaestus]RQW64232.1 translesion DNA synthesis-associated protein ImuA [Vibrio viridaestus]
MNSLIDDLKQKEWLWQGIHSYEFAHTWPTGFTNFDKMLEGGLPINGTIEVKCTRDGIGELRMWIPMLTQQEEGYEQSRLIVFIQPPGQVHAQFLVTEGIDLRQVLIIQPDNDKQALWAAEQCLKSGACRDVFLWCNTLEVSYARRLEVASHTGSCRNILFRQDKQTQFSLPVSVSLQIKPTKAGLIVQIIKKKGGWDSNPFRLDLSARWPHLTEISHYRDEHIIPFPVRQQG